MENELAKMRHKKKVEQMFCEENIEALNRGYRLSHDKESNSHKADDSFYEELEVERKAKDKAIADRIKNRKDL